jgi:hypothetical protein
VTVVLSIAAHIIFLMTLVGVSRAVWKEMPRNPGGLLLWVIVTLVVAVFAAVALLSELLLASRPSSLAHVVLLAVLVLIAILVRASWITTPTR